jgi:hypothetical protein
MNTSTNCGHCGCEMTHLAQLHWHCGACGSRSHAGVLSVPVQAKSHAAAQKLAIAVLESHAGSECVCTGPPESSCFYCLARAVADPK